MRQLFGHIEHVVVMHDAEGGRRLRQRCPKMKLIVLSFHDEPSVRRAAMEAGADGFVLTRAIATDLLPAVESVLAGGLD